MLLLFSAASIKAQDVSYGPESFVDVQRMPLKKLNDSNTFVRFDTTPLHLFVFLSPECPLCKNYSLVLNTLQEKFSSNVRFYGIVPGRTYTEDEIQRFVDEYKIQFPVLQDRQKSLSNYVRATTTPEIVLLNQSGGLVYRGAIDDWVQALGQKKAKPQQHYLENAIIQYLEKKEVLVKQTKPIGCLINEF